MKGTTQTTAMILAGGLGTRLRPAVADRPKVLAPVGGRPWLATLLDQVVEAGVSQTVLCTGWHGDMVEEAFGSRWGSMALVWSREPEPLGTAGALRWGLDRADGERLLVLNGDSCCRGDLEVFAGWAATRQAPAALVLAEVDDTSRYGRVETDATGRVLAFREKEEGSGPGLINAGIYLLDRELVAALPAGEPVSLEREVLPPLVGAGLWGWRAPGPFLDIGTPESYARAESFLREEVSL